MNDSVCAAAGNVKVLSPVTTRVPGPFGASIVNVPAPEMTPSYWVIPAGSRTHASPVNVTLALASTSAVMSDLHAGGGIWAPTPPEPVCPPLAAEPPEPEAPVPAPPPEAPDAPAPPVVPPVVPVPDPPRPPVTADPPPEELQPSEPHRSQEGDPPHSRSTHRSL